jgi:SAM-dependent methyltransferase
VESQAQYRCAANGYRDERHHAFSSEVRRHISDPEIARICDVGGGPNPELSAGEIERSNLDYVLLDSSSAQLEKAPSGYATLQADILNPPAWTAGAFDLVHSRWVAEHVPDPRSFHESIYSMLRPGGIAIHLFPTLWALPFVVNRIFPESLTQRFVSLDSLTSGASRQASGNHGKFPAYYRWCRGPTRGQFGRLRSTGFEVELSTGFFGHAYYEKIRPLAVFEQLKSDFLMKHPVPALTAASLITLRKPK